MAAVAAKADRPPSWAVGTFRGTNEKYNLEVWLRISANGRVDRAIRKGREVAEVREGSWENGELVFGRDRFEVERRRAGIMTIKVSDANDVTTFRQVGNNEWQWEGGESGGGSDNPPNWSVGTFRGFSDYHDGEMEVKIDRNGRVERTITVRGNRNTRTGYYRGGRIVVGNDTYRLSSATDGIRLTNTESSRDSTELRRGFWESRPPRDPYVRITEPDPNEEIRSFRTGIMGETNVERVRIRIYLDGRQIEDRIVDTRRNAFSSSFNLPVGDYRVEVEALYNRDVVARSQVRFSVRRQR
jgi:hypothetical protein